MTPGFYYLALPYQGSEEEKASRTALSLELTTTFLHQGIHLFAPILYVNKIADNLNFSSLEARRKVIMPYLFDFLKASQAMVLVTAKGWQESWGIQQELHFCYAQNIPVCKMNPPEREENIERILSTPLNPTVLKDLLS